MQQSQVYLNRLLSMGWAGRYIHLVQLVFSAVNCGSDLKDVGIAAQNTEQIYETLEYVERAKQNQT